MSSVAAGPRRLNKVVVRLVSSYDTAASTLLVLPVFPFYGQTPQITGSSSPKRDRGSRLGDEPPAIRGNGPKNYSYIMQPPRKHNACRPCECVHAIQKSGNDFVHGALRFSMLSRPKHWAQSDPTPPVLFPLPTDSVRSTLKALIVARVTICLCA